MASFKRAAEIYKREGMVVFLFRLLAYLKRKVGIFIYLFSVFLTRTVGQRDDIWIFGNFATDQQFSENSKYLYLETASRSDLDIRPIWITKSEDVHQTLSNEGFEVYYRNSFRAKYLTLRAKCVLLSSSLRAIPLAYAGGATIVQLTHGIPLKRPRKTSETDDDRSFLSRFRSPIERWIKGTMYSVDYFCTSSERCTEQYRRYESISHHTGYLERSIRSGEPLRTGFPRIDPLYREISESEVGTTPTEDAVVDQLNSGKTTIGYFPTFREYNAEVSPFDSNRFDMFLKTHDIQLAIKPHRHMQVEYDTTVEDDIVTIPPSMDSQLILDKIDILVTDYSSIYFDFLHLDRPVIFYTFDHGEFVHHREPMPRYEELLAGPRVEDFDSLLESIERIIDTDDHAANRARIRDSFYDHQDGRACYHLLSQIPVLTDD